MTTIPPTLKHVEGFTVTGFSTRTQNTDEFNEKTAKLPALWQQFYGSDLVANANIVEVYSNYESDANGMYTVTVGTDSDNESAEYAAVDVQTGNYLIFQGEGPMPLAVVETWKQIWAYFATEREYQRNFISDFEEYMGAERVAIHIGIK